jgi:hypothetical protein
MAEGCSANCLVAGLRTRLQELTTGLYEKTQEPYASQAQKIKSVQGHRIQ